MAAAAILCICGSFWLPVEVEHVAWSVCHAQCDTYYLINEGGGRRQASTLRRCCVTSFPYPCLVVYFSNTDFLEQGIASLRAIVLKAAPF